jgi:SAM-dependent methyltransferase
MTAGAITRPSSHPGRETGGVVGTYSDVDASDDPHDAVRWQERVDAWPHIRAYKVHVRSLVAGARRVLDVGCGPGEDVLALGTGGPGVSAVGIDRSAVMLGSAAGRGARVVRADAHALPFRDGSFDAVIADRVLSHVADPGGALRAAAGVLAPRGRLVVADSDQESLAIHLPGVPDELVDRVKARRRAVGYRNGRFVSTVPEALCTMGFRDVTVDAFPLVLTDPQDAFGFAGWPRLWQADGGFADDDVRTWESAVERVGRDGGFVYAVSYLVVSGRTG